MSELFRKRKIQELVSSWCFWLIFFNNRSWRKCFIVNSLGSGSGICYQQCFLICKFQTLFSGWYPEVSVWLPPAKCHLWYINIGSGNDMVLYFGPAVQRSHRPILRSLWLYWWYHHTCFHFLLFFFHISKHGYFLLQIHATVFMIFQKQTHLTGIRCSLILPT